LSGVAAVETYQQALRKVMYQDTASSPTSGQRTIDVVVSDGIASGNTASTMLTVEG
jgi:hypothetical protein